MAASRSCVVSLTEIHRFVRDAMVSVGTPKSHATAMAEVLVSADYRGHFSHGLNRLEMYVRDVSSKSTDAMATPKVLSEKPATALVDGMNALGPVVGNYCMDLAIEKAKGAGVGWVSARGSNHYGIAGWYSIRAMEKGLVGMSFTNTSPLLSPTRAKAAALGTNPLAVAAPANEDSFVLDMATTAVALGKIELQRRKGESMPLGWAQDSNGRLTSDPQKALEAYCLCPLGGAEQTSGYKGTGLALMVEIFCGILAGAKYGPFVRNWSNTDKMADLGQCFVALDPAAFAPGFQDRLAHMLEAIRKLERVSEWRRSRLYVREVGMKMSLMKTKVMFSQGGGRKEKSNIAVGRHALQQVDPEKPILLPGDPEKEHMKKADDRGGIEYHRNQIDACIQLAEELKISPMKTLN